MFYYGLGVLQRGSRGHAREGEGGGGEALARIDDLGRRGVLVSRYSQRVESSGSSDRLAGVLLRYLSGIYPVRGRGSKGLL